jgi:hypothetical protein
MGIVPIETMEAAVWIASRWVIVVLLGAYVFAARTVSVLAQEGNPLGQAGAHAPRMTAEAARLEGLGGEPEALLGGPATPGDPYGPAFDATRGGEERALARTERLPRGAAANGRDERQPAVKPHAQLRGVPADNPPREGKIDKADPGTRSPTESALSIYHGPGDVGKAVGEVYKMPW